MTHAEGTIQAFVRHHRERCHAQPDVQQLSTGYVRLRCPRCREEAHVPLTAIRSAAAATRAVKRAGW